MSDDLTTNVEVDELRSLVADALDLPVEEVTDAATFADDLGVDSLMALEIAVSLERRYGTKIQDEELAQVTSFSAVLELVRDKLGSTVGS